MKVLASLFSEADFTGASREGQASFGPSSSTVPTMRESWDVSGASEGARDSFTGPATDIWVSFNLLTTSPDAYDINAVDNLINVRGSNQPLFRFAVDVHASGKEYFAQIWNGTSFQTVGTPFVIADLVRTRFDIHMVISDTVGVFDIYTDKVNLVSSFSGDTALTGVTAFDELYIAPSINAGQRVSGCYVSDESTLDNDAIQVRLNGAGFASEFTGTFGSIEHSNATTITPFSDASFIETTTLGRKSYFTTDAITGFDNHEVLAISTNARAKSETVNNSGLSIIERHGGTDSASPAQVMRADRFGPLKHTFYPDNGAGGLITVSEMGPLEVAVQNGST